MKRLLLLFLFLYGWLSASQTHFTVALDKNYAPFSYLDSNGKAQGFYIDLWRVWAKTNKYTISFIGSNWSESVQNVHDKKADFHASVYEKNSKMELAQSSLHKENVALFVPLYKKIHNVKSLDGKDIGVIDPFFGEMLKALYPNINILVFENYDKVFQFIDEDKIDAFFDTKLAVTEQLSKLQRRHEFAILETKESIAIKAHPFSYSSSLIKIFDAGWQQVRLEDKLAIESKWIDSKVDRTYANQGEKKVANKLLLTSEEQRWLKRNPLIKLAIMNYWQSDPSGQNIHTELIKLLNKYGQINIIPIRYDRWKDGFDEAVRGDFINGIMNLSWSKNREEKHFYYSEPYDAKPNFLVVRQENSDIKSLDDLVGKRVYFKESSITKTILQEHSSQIELLQKKDLDSMLYDLYAKNEADAIFTYQVSPQQLKKYQLKIVKKVYGKYATHHIGINHKFKELHRIIQKVFKLIPKAELIEIQQKLYAQGDKTKRKKIDLTREELSWIESNPIIKVGGELDWAPFDFVDESGNYSGLAKDYLDLIASMTGLNFDVVTGKSWSELLLALKEGSIDMLPAIYFSKERQSYANFTTSYLAIADYYVTKTSYPRIDSIKSLYDREVVAIKGYDVTTWLKEKHPQIKLIEVDSVIEALRSVESGESVAFLNDNPSSTYTIEKNFISGLKINNVVKQRIPIPLHMATKKGYSILTTILNKAIKNISKESKREISEHWMSRISSNIDLNLSEDEMFWVSKKQVLTFAVDPSWLPIEAINSNTGQYEGMTSDLLKTITDLTSIEFKLRPTKKWSESVELIKNGEVDMVASVSITPERKDFLNFTDKTFTLFDGVIMKNDATFITSVDGLKGYRVGVSQGTALHDMLKKEYPFLILVPIKGIDKGLQELEKGDIDAFIGNLEVASQIIFQKSLFNLKVVLKLDRTRHLHIGLNKDVPKEARTILNKAISLITNEEIQTIRQRWVGLKINEEIDYSIFYKIAVGIFLLILFFTYWNRKLQRLVNQRTSDLEEQKNKLAEFNKNLEGLVSQRTLALEEAKYEIEEIHKLTKESIEYASLIQYALIPENKAFDPYFQEHFSMWKPKDIVGGDIYLFEELRGDHECLLMVIDCTGHGVPGAFVTMLVKAIERQVVSKIVNNPDMKVSPAWILYYFNKSMKRILKQDNNDSIANAGFDGGILYYNKQEGVIKYAGAEIPLFYIQDNELKMIKGDRHSIGYKKSDLSYEFQEHTIPIKEGMQCYLTTDGYVDQNGGTKGFPFGKKRFKSILDEVKIFPMKQQEKVLLQRVQEYKGGYEQNDDVTVIGLKF